MTPVTGMRGWIEVPEGWAREKAKGPWPFVTAERFRRPDGSTYVWGSRSHRKRSAAPSGSTWWAPGTRGWWIGVLFAVGSELVTLYVRHKHTDAVYEGASAMVLALLWVYYSTQVFFFGACVGAVLRQRSSRAAPA